MECGMLSELTEQGGALEAAIGVLFIFTLMAGLSSMLVELLSAVVSLRARTLRRGIQSLLDDSTVRLRWRLRTFDQLVPDS